MQFKLDENLPVELANLFGEAGHDAVTVLDQGLGGAGDPDVASACLRERRTIVTLDTTSLTSGRIRLTNMLASWCFASTAKRVTMFWKSLRG